MLRCKKKIFSVALLSVYVILQALVYYIHNNYNVIIPKDVEYPGKASFLNDKVKVDRTSSTTTNKNELKDVRHNSIKEEKQLSNKFTLLNDKISRTTAITTAANKNVLQEVRYNSKEDEQENKAKSFKKLESIQLSTNRTFQYVQHNSTNLDAQIPETIFSPWKEEGYPCFQGYDNQRKSGADLRGLIYVRIRKASSTTLASVNMRIAHNNIENFTGQVIVQSTRDLELQTRCATTYDHVPGHILDIHNRTKNSTFLWTFVREPAARSISHFFYFRVSRDEFEPGDDQVIKFLENKKNRNVQLRFAHPKHIEHSLENPSIDEVKYQVQEILNEYDFIGLTERFDESLVVLQLLLNLSIGDILYLSTNIGGHYDKHKVKDKALGCMKIVKSYTSDVVKEYLSSKEFYEMNSGDFILHQAANRSLDLTIEKIGKAKFESALSSFQEIKSYVQEACSNIDVGPCTKDGVLQQDVSRKNCYLDDFGCGFKCLDRNYYSLLDKLKSKK